jgi:hypothetical protein
MRRDALFIKTSRKACPSILPKEQFFMKHIKQLTTSLIGLALLLSQTDAQASQLLSRNQLDSLLGANQIFEDFETPVIAGQTRYSGGAYNASVDFAGLGTNLIVDGVTIQRNTADVTVGAAGYRGIDWNPAGYFGATSQRISGAGGGGGASTRNDFQFIFTAPVNAFGLDLTAYDGFASSGQVSVYDTADNLLATLAVAGTSAGTFFGWENANGIGKVFFHDNPNGNYIQFDNLGFGVSAVPVPGAVWLFGSALAGLLGFGRRKQAIAA